MYEKILLYDSRDFGLFIGKELEKLNISKTFFADFIIMDVRNVKKLTNGYRKQISIEDRLYFLEKLENLSKTK